MKRSDAFEVNDTRVSKTITGIFIISVIEKKILRPHLFSLNKPILEIISRGKNNAAIRRKTIHKNKDNCVNI
jgi:hypothetical protein